MFEKEEIYIGSTGFSQMGTPDYYEKAKFEGTWLKEHFSKKFMIPPGLHLWWKKNPYEHDYYWDLSIYYYINDFKEGSLEMEAIWKCINEMESYDIESLEEQIQEAWDKKIRKEKIAAVVKGDGSHLSKVV